MNLLETMVGDANFSSGSSRVGVFVTPSADFTGFTKEQPLFAAARNGIVTRQNFIGKVSAWAQDSARPELGTWMQCVYNVPEGMVLKIFAHMSQGHGRPMYNGAQFIRIRRTAAYRELRVALHAPMHARYQHAVIKGRFDLLTMEEAKGEGVDIDPRYTGQFRESMTAPLFSVVELEQEIASAVVVRKRAVKRRRGERVIVKKVRKARAFDLGDDD